MTKSPDFIYSDDYYRMEKLILDERFIERVQTLKDEYKNMGHPIPDKGFKNNDQYIDWYKAFTKTYRKANKTELDRVLTPLKTNESITQPNKGIAITLAKQKVLPLLPEAFVDNLLKDLGYDNNNMKFYSFISDHIFMGKKHLAETAFKLVFKYDKDGNLELSLALTPYTKPEHIVAFWKDVLKYQKSLNGFRGKNKKHTSFERDLHIYKVYKKLESERIGKRSSGEALDILTVNTIKNSGKRGFIGLTTSMVRKAIARIKALDNVQFKDLV